MGREPFCNYTHMGSLPVTEEFIWQDSDDHICNHIQSSLGEKPAAASEYLGTQVYSILNIRRKSEI